jgi:ketosteroid isomerase-like protein
MLSAEDRWAIGETVSLHGHLFDRGQLDRLEELFTPDVVYDVTHVGKGMGTFVGIEEMRRGALELGAGNPIAHHVTNIVITSGEGDQVTAQSKGLVITDGGRCGSATYIDTLRRADGGWRISHRVVLPQRTPLNGAHLPSTDSDESEGR